MAYLKATIGVLLTCLLTYTATALNIYISKEHLSEYYQNSDIDTKVEVVHSKKPHVSSSGRLTLHNGTELLPFPEEVNVVTFTWLTGKEAEVTYGIKLQEDLKDQSGLLVTPAISISDTGLVPDNRSTFDVTLQCTVMASGTARVNVNLSLHYDDGFNTSAYFFLEKHCTADSSDFKTLTDVIQPTETVQNMKTSDDSGEGSGKESIVDTVNVVPPESPVVTLSHHHNSSTSQTTINMSITSSPLMGSSVSVNQSSVTTSVILSSMLLTSTQQSPIPATTLPSSVVVDSVGVYGTVVISSLLQSAVPVPSSMAAVASTSVTMSSSPSVTVSQLSDAVTSSVLTSSTTSNSSIQATVATSTQPQIVTTVIESSSVATQLNTSSVSSLVALSTSAVTTKLTSTPSPSMTPYNSSLPPSSSQSISLSTTSSVSLSSKSSGYSVSSSITPSSTVSVTSSPVVTKTIGNTSIESTVTSSTALSSAPVTNITSSSSSSSLASIVPTMVHSDDSRITSMLSSTESSSVVQQTAVTSTSIPAVIAPSSRRITSSAVSTVVSTVSVSSSSSDMSTVSSSEAPPSSTAVMSSPLLGTSSVSSVTTSSLSSSDTQSISVSSSSITLLSEISSSETTSSSPIVVPTTSIMTSTSVLAASSSSVTSSEVPPSTTITSSTSSSEIASTTIESAISSETLRVSSSSMPVSDGQTTSISVTSSAALRIIFSSETKSPSSLNIRSTTLLSTSSDLPVAESTSETMPVSSSALPTPVVSVSSSPVSTHPSSTTPGTASPLATVSDIDDSESNEPSLTLIIIVAATTSALITICIMLICIIFALAYKRRRKPKKRLAADNPIHIEFKSPIASEMKLKEEEEYIGPPSVWTSLRWGSIRNLSRPAQKLVQQLTVERDSVEVLDTIRKGEYGWLIKGKAALETDDNRNGTPIHRLVLIKMITGLGLGTKACGSCEEVSEFLSNATLLRSIRHPNLLPVLGLNSDDHKAPIVIYSHPEIGSLHTFLTSHKGDGSDAKLKEPLTPKLLMDFCVQLSEAMRHLECFHVVHPDLQLRTCQLDGDLTLKLGDGALMSDFYPECYHVVYGAQRPVRWSALETLQGGLCTLPSNVWSFGITLWEIVTLGEFPYSDVTNRNVLAHVMLGSRLEQPYDCPNEMYELMCNCWNTSPRQRPIFTNITNQLKNLARLYSSDDDIGGIHTSDSAFFIRQREWEQQPQSPTQSFHYNDQNMSHLLTAQISASDAVSITFSALGSTEDLTQTGVSASSIDDNRHHSVMSPLAIPTETSSSIHSPEESLPPTPLSPAPHINIVPATASYGIDHKPMVPSRVPLRNEPVNRYLLKADGSRESTPDQRLSMSSDSQYSSSQFSTDMSESSRQHLLRHKRDSPDKRPVQAAIAEQRQGDEPLSSNTSNPVPVIKGDMLSELMASFDEQMNNPSNQ